VYIHSIRIQRYRGIEELEWQPRPGLNCVIGPGDVGKTTVLAATALLLDPRPSQPAAECDYYRRRVGEGFAITAVLGGLTSAITDGLRVPLLHGWKDGLLRPLPDEDGAEPVLVARVSGSPELEVTHTLVGPGEHETGEGVPFTVTVRQRFGLAPIAAGTRAASELRLGRGTLLARHAGSTDLRGALTAAVADASADLELPGEVEDAVQTLRELFAQAGLPADLHFGIASPQGSSLLGLVHLLSGPTIQEAIPVANAGMGTRQLALFQPASVLLTGVPIVVLDEPEAGLEPYRQRRLIADVRRLVGSEGQAFFTTHSPAILGVLQPGELTRIAADQRPVVLHQPGVGRLLREDPDALLSRLPVLAEGLTEAGFLAPMLHVFADEDGVQDLDTLGIRLVARGGQPHVLDEVEALLAAGMDVGAFIDDEQQYSGRRDRIAAHERCAFGSWNDTGVRNIEEAVARWLPFPQLPRVVEAAAAVVGRSVEPFLAQVGAKAGHPGTTTLEVLADKLGEGAVRTALEQAMQASGKAWFKSLDGGPALGRLLVEVGPPPQIDGVVRGLWTAIRRVLG
jgi:putative ATP-dependent endonuclease of OLD family